MSTTSEVPAEAPVRTPITPEALLSMPDGGRYELIDGELKERKTSILSSSVAVRVIRALSLHAEEHRLGWVLSSKLGYRCFPWEPCRVRRARLSFIRTERLDEGQFRQSYATIAPDLAVEVVSPNDLAAELDEKLEDYLRAGVRLIWVINPESRTLQVSRADGTGLRLHEADEVTGEDVIPGFRCVVGSFFPPAPAEPQPAAPAAGG